MKIMAAFLLLILSVVSHAHFVDGNELVANMRDWERASQKSTETNYMNASHYSGYVKGVHDALELSDVICPPDNVTVGQVNAIVAKFLNANPERWGKPAFFLVSQSLKGAFPCKAR